MQIEKFVSCVPIYICETPAVKYRETWRHNLYEEIALLLDEKPEPILLRGSHAENLDKVARTGSDMGYPGKGGLIYVVPYQSVVSIYYPFSRAATCMLIYKSSGLVECVGDAENMGFNFNRYQFLVPPKKTLLGIIDLREVNRKSKRLRSLDKEAMCRMDKPGQT